MDSTENGTTKRIPTNELVRLCREKLEWKKSTTYTVIRRLSERGVIKSEDAIVTSLVSREDAQSAESTEIVERTFSGSLPRCIWNQTEYGFN